VRFVCWGFDRVGVTHNDGARRADGGNAGNGFHSMSSCRYARNTFSSI
jgi:hypothetical protein